MLHIFTDGACPSNGRKLARAAYGCVLWNLGGVTGPICISEVLPLAEPQTNQRAELRGLKRAFDEIQERGLKGPITIWTDSEYGRKAITEWGPQWRVRGWRRAQNATKPLEHLDILKPMVEWYEANQHYVLLRHIKAHSKKKEFPYTGNQLADEIAVKAVQAVQDALV